MTVVNANTTATDRLIYNGATNIITSGIASGALALNASPAVNNEVKVEVTSQDGATVKTYIVNVARLASLVRPQITNSFNGSQVTLEWPVENTTYRLQAQTNSASVGLTHQLGGDDGCVQHQQGDHYRGPDQRNGVFPPGLSVNPVVTHKNS